MAYREASTVLDGLLKKKGGLKTLAFSDKVTQKRRSYALVCETLKYKEVLDDVLKTATPAPRELQKIKNKALLYIMLFDFLFGKGIQGGGTVKKMILKHKEALHASLKRLKVKRKVTSNVDLLPEHTRNIIAMPRYARVNTLKTSVQAVLDHFSSSSSSEGDDTDPICIKRDQHIPNLLLFPSGTELHSHPMVQDGSLILQDKASCFPAQVLVGEMGEGGGGDVIDACAAPGNKTSHCAALLKERAAAAAGGEGEGEGEGPTVFAFDKSPRRLQLLRERMRAAGARPPLVTPRLQSFLDVDPAAPSYQNTRSILLDPSCSGSGMVSRLDHLLDGSRDQEGGDGEAATRLAALAEFQLQAVLKAFSFPQVNRVTYSTCSIHIEENEAVVAAALRDQQQATPGAPRFRLARALPSWRRRGVAHPQLTANQSDCLVRCDASHDDTNGFFVALFVRGGAEGEEGEGEGDLSTAAECLSTDKSKKRKREGEHEGGEGEVGDEDALDEEEGGGGGARSRRRTSSWRATGARRKRRKRRSSR